MTPIVMISFYTPDNVIRLVRELARELSHVPVVVFDNNTSHRLLDGERAFLDALPWVRRVPVGPDLEHGDVIDFGREWLLSQGYETMVHIEPDCIVHSAKWYNELVTALEGRWGAFSIHLEDGRYHPTPSAWDLRKTQHLSWRFRRKGDEVLDKQYSSLVKDERCVCPWLRKSWDTAQYAWYCCARDGMAAAVPGTDFRHLWGGSSKFSMFQTPLL